MLIRKQDKEVKVLQKSVMRAIKQYLNSALKHIDYVMWDVLENNRMKLPI